MAYRQLSPAARARWVGVLEGHPEASRWKETCPVAVPGLDVGAWLFMRAGNWPDEIRRSGSPYDHPVWHYVDYPLRAPDYPLLPAPAGEENVLTAIEACRRVLADPAASAPDQGAHLAWLIHLVADLAQPLHCAELFNDQFPAPEGDRGGNRFFILFAGNPMNLHWFWDSVVAQNLDPAAVSREAGRLASRYPCSDLPELLHATDPTAWSLEGRAVAVESVYRRGALRGSPTKDDRDLPPLPADYLLAAKAVGERRLVLGACRLADLLNAR